MEAMAEFFESPTEGYLEGLTKNQLREVAEHYKFNETLPKDLRKQELKEGVRKGLVERSIIVARSYPLIPTAASTPTRSESGSPARRNDLSFEQQMELLKMQNAEREKDRQLELEKMIRGDKDREDKVMMVIMMMMIMVAVLMYREMKSALRRDVSFELVSCCRS